MNNFEFLKNFMQLQYELMFDELIDLNFVTVGYSKIDESALWNFALTNNILSDEKIVKIEEVFRLLKRNPTFYCENRANLIPFCNSLVNKGYEISFEDSWKFWNGDNINNKYFESIKKVNNLDELKIFLETFNNCYQKNDSQNPYGELGNYLTATKNVWHKHNKTSRVKYFIVYKKEKPVGVATLTNYKKIGYISNVGSLKETRGQGYGKAITLYCVDQSKKYGNIKHCLLTEEGTYPDEFYNRLGFKTKFKAVGYTKASVL